MQSLTPYLPHIVLGLVIFSLVQFFLLLGANSRISQQSKLLRNLLTGPNGDDLETMLRRCLEESKGSLARCDMLEASVSELAGAMRGCVQKMGLVRYDAFPDVSGAQSFSLCFLDDRHNGAIVTGLLGRNDGRCYGKAVFAGATETTLSEEENSALQMALHGGLTQSGSEERELPRRGRRGAATRA
ncbi:MAG TPA: DUF4446 family protein [Abditibacteriaceae bacterium]|jgi:hypothetical protein